MDETSSFSSGTEREAGYTHIQKQIHALDTEEAVRSWKQRYNELSLIFRLPRELLAIVFKEVAQLPSYPKFRWLMVTHVCFHWRQVALGDPYMWNHITFERPDLAQEMLNRSRTAPLVVEVIFGSIRGHLRKAEDAVLEQTLKQLHRIKNLKLNLRYHSTFRVQTLLELLEHSAPLLETCSIELATDAQLPTLFSNTCPRLTTLSMTGCNLDWKSSSFGALRKLDIDSEHSQKQSFDDILSALSSMPLLERFKYRSKCDESMTMSVAPTVNLPCLQSLDITSNLTACILLNDGIIRANTSRIQFMCLPDSGLRYNSIPLRALATSIGNKLPGLISYLNIEERNFIAKGPPDLHPTSEYVLEISLSQYTFCFHTFEFESSYVFESLLQPLPLQYLQYLSIGRARIPSSDWVTVFGDLKHLTSITVIEFAQWDGFIEALAFRCTSMANSSGNKFVALEELTIRRWQFDASVPFGTAVSENVDTVGQNLKECLRMRKEHGIFLGKLFLGECRHVTEVEVDELKEIGMDIHWRGQLHRGR